MDEINSMISHAEITRNLAVLTGIDSQTHPIKSLNQEMIKVGGGHPFVEFVKEDDTTQSMKSDQWVTNCQMRMSRCKQSLDKRKSKADNSEKAIEREIIKNLGILEFEKFEPAKNCLVWLANLISTIDGKEHLLTGANSATGFGKILIGCQSGDDLERAKLYSTNPSAS